MKLFLRFWSYLINPLFVPGIVSFWYFLYLDFYVGENARNKMFLILILTAAVPLLIFILLKVVDAVKSVHLTEVKERVTPLISYVILLLILLRTVFTHKSPVGLYYFFIGVLLATIVATVLSIARYKISLHLMSMGGALGFAIMLSLTLGLPLRGYIIGLSLVSGIVASSRLEMKAHKGHELIFGFCTGLFTQVISQSYALQVL
ncbi:MAG: hypothetical protein WBA16_08870 [Nonlabens sp.]